MAWGGSRHMAEQAELMWTHIRGANVFRGDLPGAGIGNGVHAFNVSTPTSVKDGVTHIINARIGGTGILLSSSPKSLTCSANGGL